MKITFILPDANLRGGTRVIAIYAQYLQQKGHEILVVSTPKGPPSFKEQLKSLLKGKGWIATPNNPSHLDDVNVPHKVIESSRPINDHDIPDADVVIATWWETAEWVAKFLPEKGTKVYFIQHFEAHSYFSQEIQARVKATYSLPMYKIVIAQWLVELMKSEYHDHNVALIPNSVDLVLFSAEPRSKQKVLTVGLMYSPLEWKGCRIALESVNLARKNIPDLHLVAFGGKAPTEDLPLPANTDYFLQPRQEEISKIYSQCDVWLFSSTSEGFGLPILEAMACRTPVIGTPAGAAPELLANGAGILVKMADATDMALAINKIAEMSELEWQAMSNICYEKAHSYSWEDATNLMESALHKAIANH
jgi:glycosyltransferase involved in cell wall biosynthesis